MISNTYGVININDNISLLFPRYCQYYYKSANSVLNVLGNFNQYIGYNVYFIYQHVLPRVLKKNSDKSLHITLQHKICFNVICFLCDLFKYFPICYYHALHFICPILCFVVSFRACDLAFMYKH